MEATIKARATMTIALHAADHEKWRSQSKPNAHLLLHLPLPSQNAGAILDFAQKGVAASIADEYIIVVQSCDTAARKDSWQEQQRSSYLFDHYLDIVLTLTAVVTSRAAENTVTSCTPGSAIWR